jgi:DNA-binding response OmpR family regulator
LCIDDNDEITTLLDRVLSAKGFDFVSCNDGTVGLKLIKTEDFDVVLLDIAMPNVSGLDIINDLKIKNLVENSNIILFTASNISNEKLDTFLKAGVKDCIRKPVRIEKLLSILNKFER